MFGEKERVSKNGDGWCEMKWLIGSENERVGGKIKG